MHLVMFNFLKFRILFFSSSLLLIFLSVCTGVCLLTLQSETFERCTTDEHFVWDAVFHPATPWLCFFIAIIIGIICKCRKTPCYLPVKTCSVLLLLCTATYFLLNPASTDGCISFVPSLLFFSALVCLSVALLRKWAILAWFPVFLLTVIDRVAGFMHVSLGYPNLMQLFGASWVDFKDYLTVVNVSGMVLALCFSAVAFYPFFRILKKTGRWTLVSHAFLCFALAAGILQCGRHVMEQNRTLLWPMGSTLSISYHSCRALKNIHGIHVMCSNLPDKNQTHASTDLIKPNSGVVCIVHVGESVRADRLSLNGWHNNTTPWLDEQKERLINFKDCVSVAPMTDRALMTILTNSRRDYLTVKNRAELPSSPPLPDFFSESGKFTTASFWPIGSLHGKTAPMFAAEVRYFTRSMAEVKETEGYPLQQVQPVIDYLDKHRTENIFLLLNNRGSHCPFKDFETEGARFPVTQKVGFHLHPEINEQDAADVNNAYDNTVAELDEYIRRIVTHLAGRPLVYVYVSDHGDYVGQEGYWYRIYTDESLYFKHNACKVPFLAWVSPEFEALSPAIAEKVAQLRAHNTVSTGQEHCLHTVLGLFGIQTPYYKAELDLSSPQVKPYTGPHPDRGGKPAQGDNPVLK